MTRSSSAKSNSPSFGSTCSHETLPRTVLKLEAANLDQTVSMYSEELRAEFCSSPPSMRKGRPLTSNCVDAPILWREGKLQIVVVFIVGKRVTLAGRNAIIRQQLQGYTRRKTLITMRLRKIWRYVKNLHFYLYVCGVEEDSPIVIT